MSFPKYFSTFVVGMAVGAGFALLVAPMPGKKMQKKVAKITDHVIDKVDDFRNVVQRVAS